jgi:Ras-related GTP-binding protein C/D
MSPNETLFLESTTSVQKDEVHHSHFLSFDIIDFPGQLEYFDPAFSNDAAAIFTGVGALIFVIDAQVRAAAVRDYMIIPNYVLG